MLVVIALQVRGALGDDIGVRLRAKRVVVMIGGRPGLSSPGRLGVDNTDAPRVGRTEAERNCISNIRPEGLGYAAAAQKLDWLAVESLRRALSGVGRKDDSSLSFLAGG